MAILMEKGPAELKGIFILSLGSRTHLRMLLGLFFVPK